MVTSVSYVVFYTNPLSSLSLSLSLSLSRCLFVSLLASRSMPSLLYTTCASQATPNQNLSPAHHIYRLPCPFIHRHHPWRCLCLGFALQMMYM
ncbi:hypothetical protein F4810DRAFT_382698 [Camillea tinctor]|nr:hypothetical protein F4810DRAFT_382698 [Camillea tinctor]